MVGIVSVLFLLCGTVQAAELTFPIVTDACMDSQSAAKNFGAATTVKVVINSNASSICRGVFQLPSEVSLYATDQIAKATVLFYVWRDYTTNLNITLFPLARSFVEGVGGNSGVTNAGVTWGTYDGTNAWANAGGDFDTNFPVVGVKGAILDTNYNDRFFSWDITALLTNDTARIELLNYGALLQIDEIPPPANGSPRAPFTSSDATSYDEEFRPQVQLLVIPRTAGVSQVSIEEDSLVFSFSNCTPYVTNRIERNYDLQQADGWTWVTNLVTSESETHWMAPVRSAEFNAFYRIRVDE
jgi:hypothetical protein